MNANASLRPTHHGGPRYYARKKNFNDTLEAHSGIIIFFKAFAWQCIYQIQIQLQWKLAATLSLQCYFTKYSIVPSVCSDRASIPAHSGTLQPSHKEANHTTTYIQSMSTRSVFHKSEGSVELRGLPYRDKKRLILRFRATPKRVKVAWRGWPKRCRRHSGISFFNASCMTALRGVW